MPGHGIGAFTAWQGQKGAGLADGVGKARQMPAAADQVQEIAVLAGRGIALMCS